MRQPEAARAREGSPKLLPWRRRQLRDYGVEEQRKLKVLTPRGASAGSWKKVGQADSL